MQKLGKERFASYLNNFQLGSKTGIPLTGEVSGNLDSILNLEREVEFATASFGQGIAVTPLGFTRAIAALANHGKLMKPIIVSKVIKEGEAVKVFEPQEVVQVISPRAAESISRILVDVVDKTLAGGKIKIPGFSIAAKTGTAQIPSQDARGYSDEYLHTFFGYLPAFDARAVVFMGLVKPKGVRYASESLAPAFSDISRFLINYYDIPPDNLPFSSSTYEPTSAGEANYHTGYRHPLLFSRGASG